MTDPNHLIRLEPATYSPDFELVIEVVGGGQPYLWVGSEKNGCYGTVEIPKRVERALRETVQPKQRGDE